MFADSWVEGWLMHRDIQVRRSWRQGRRRRRQGGDGSRGASASAPPASSPGCLEQRCWAVGRGKQPAGRAAGWPAATAAPAAPPSGAASNCCALGELVGVDGDGARWQVSWPARAFCHRLPIGDNPASPGLSAICAVLWGRCCASKAVRPGVPPRRRRRRRPGCLYADRLVGTFQLTN